MNLQAVYSGSGNRKCEQQTNEVSHRGDQLIARAVASQIHSCRSHYCGRITGHPDVIHLPETCYFHEKAGPCQAVFLGRANRTADCRPTGGTVSPRSFLHRKVFRPGYRYSRSPTSGRRTMLPSQILKSPTRPTSIRTLSGAIAPVPAGCPQLETGAAVSWSN